MAKTNGIEGEQLLNKGLQALLAERFHLASHLQKQELAVYDLVRSRNVPALRAAAVQHSASLSPAGGALVFESFTMPEFAEQMSSRPIRVDRPVVDKSGLAGAFDFTLHFSDNADDMKSTLENLDRGNATGISIFSILEDQLGLKLLPRKGPVDVLVIDQIERTPTAN